MKTGNLGIILPWVVSSSNADAASAAEGTLIYDINDGAVKLKTGTSTWFDFNGVSATSGNINTSSYFNDYVDQLFQTENADAQVIIGADVTADEGVLVLAETNKAMLLPIVNNPELNIVNPALGMVVYDADSDVVAVYNGEKWNYWGGATITFSDKIKYIASIYDADYLPYTSQTTAASTGTVNAGTSINDEVTYDLQGTLTTTGVTVNIPYEVTGGSYNLSSYSETYTVISDHVQDPNNATSTTGGGTAHVIELSYPAQTLAEGTGVIEATLKALNPVGSGSNSDLDIVKLDINNGVGNSTDGYGLEIASFAIDDETTVTLKAITGIPDKRYGDETTQGGVLGFYHNNLYLPATNADGSAFADSNGKQWLNFNLGSYYANVENDAFAIANIPTSIIDFNAFGSKYQWGRFSDGHELWDYSESTLVPFVNGNRINGTTTDRSSSITPPTNQFILDEVTERTASKNWLTTYNDDLWLNESVQNNPCPKGFLVPLQSEMLLFGNDITEAFNSSLNIVGAGTTFNVNFGSIGDGRFWCRDTSADTGRSAAYTSNGTFAFGTSRQSGRSVRCIRE